MTQPSRAPSPDGRGPYLTLPRTEALQNLDGQISYANGILSPHIRYPNDLENRRKEYLLWDGVNKELLRRMFTDGTYAAEYPGERRHFVVTGYESFNDKAEEFIATVKRKRECLESIRFRLPYIPEDPSLADRTPDDRAEQTGSKVFLVHGHDDGMKETVARYLEKLNLEVVIFHEHADGGRTIIEKLEDLSEDIGFAVVLMTPDDVGRAAIEEKLLPRARQNVILEFGYFLGKLRRPHVAVIYSKGVEFPSDYDGVLYTELDEHGRWRDKLKREIGAAGLPVDTNGTV